MILWSDHNIKVAGDINQPWELRSDRFSLQYLIDGAVTSQSFTLLNDLIVNLNEVLKAFGYRGATIGNIKELVGTGWHQRTAQGN